MANTRQDRLYEQERVLVNTPSGIKRKMLGSRKYKKVRDSKNEQAKEAEQN